nr:MAG TPA: hypothetical protein [Caudoviricetes sp.]
MPWMLYSSVKSAISYTKIYPRRKYKESRDFRGGVFLATPSPVYEYLFFYYFFIDIHKVILDYFIYSSFYFSIFFLFGHIICRFCYPIQVTTAVVTFLYVKQEPFIEFFKDIERIIDCC